MKNFAWLGAITILFVAHLSVHANTTSPANEADPGAPAQIYLFRPTSPPAGRNMNVRLDGNKIGEIFVRRYAVIQVPPGRHKLTINSNYGGGESIDFECHPGKRYYISYTSLMGSLPNPVGPLFVTFHITPRIELVTEEIARRHINVFALAFTHNLSLEPGLPRVVEIIDVQAERTVDEIRNVILGAAARYSWTVKDDKPGTIVLHQAKKRWDSTLVVKYDANTIYIHSDSRASGEKAVPQGWILNLKKGILAGIRNM